MYMENLRERYARQIILPQIGEEGQLRLHNASVLIVGLGGLGCPVALYLAGAGVGRIGLCDADIVSLSNLQRQTLYDSDMIGLRKSEAAGDRLRALNPDVVCEPIAERFTDGNADTLVKRYDLVIDCSDNFTTRFLIDDVCRRHGRPWIFGSIGEFNGYVSTFLPGNRDLGALFPDREELMSRPAAMGGVLGAVPGIVGAVEAAEALKVLCGIGNPLSGRVLVIDALAMTFETLEF